MNIVFRVDSGLDIGTGHLMRCITLANLLTKSDDHQCFFVCRPHNGNISELIIKNNFKLLELPTSNNKIQQLDSDTWLGELEIIDADDTIQILKNNNINNIDLLVVDHYAISSTWEASLSSQVTKLMVIDDLANRQHICDVLLDQNIAPNYNSRYNALVPDDCKKFLGVSYCLLRDDFFKYRNNVQARTSLDNLFIFFGGVDKDNSTYTLLKAMNGKFSEFNCVHVVVGSTNLNKKKIQDICEVQSNYIFHEQVSNIAELMAKSDLSIGAGGTTTGERIFLGLPSLVFSLAENQVEVSKHLHEQGLIYYLGNSSQITLENIEQAINSHIGSFSNIHTISTKLLNVSISKLNNLINELNSY